MSNELALLSAAVVALLIWGLVGYVAHRRHRSVIGWLLVAFLTTSPIALIALIVLPARGEPMTPARHALLICFIVVGVAAILATIWAIGYEP